MDGADQQSHVDSDERVHIDVHELTSHPHFAWQHSLQQEVGEVRRVYPEQLIDTSSKSSIKFVCISDTHSCVESGDFADNVPHGDVLLHCGDFTRGSKYKHFVNFNEFLGKLPHQIKLLIPGNHEMILDPRFVFPGFKHVSIDAMKAIITNAKILIDELVEICGIKIYGVPWVPSYGTPGFSLERGAPLLQKYNLIPDDVDILLSHGPPLGFGDFTYQGKHAGCLELLNTVRRHIQPKYLVCGHLHDGYGIRTDGTTTYINASICNSHYKPINQPVVFDYALSAPHKRKFISQYEISEGRLDFKGKVDS